MSRTNWKGLERKVAADLGEERNSKKGLGEEVPDVIKELGDGSFVIIETKNRTRVDVEESLKQAEGYTKEGDVPVFVFRETGKHSLEVFIRLKHFILLYRKLRKKSSFFFSNIILQLTYKDFLCIMRPLYDKADKSNKGK